MLCLGSNGSANKLIEITQYYVTSIDSCLILYESYTNNTAVYDCICNVQLVIIFQCYQNENKITKSG